MVQGQDEHGLYVIEQKNKFCVGDVIEIMKQDGRTLRAPVLAMADEDGNPMDSCPHPRQMIHVNLNSQAEEGDILRMPDQEK